MTQASNFTSDMPGFFSGWPSKLNSFFLSPFCVEEIVVEKPLLENIKIDRECNYSLYTLLQDCRLQKDMS